MDHPASLLIYERLDYRRAWALQHHLVHQRIEGQRADTLVLLEHDPVFTVGRSGQAGHLILSETALRAQGCPVYDVERGGSVTYHGPGQVVGYPILLLRSYCPGPKTYMRMLEEVLIRTLADWGIQARRRDRLTGVWVGSERPAKIASMGVRIREGVTMHGFALNVTVDLRPFDAIVPCGIPGCLVTSMAEVCGSAVDSAEVRATVAEQFRRVFGLHWITSPEAGLVEPSPDLPAQGTHIPWQSLRSPVAIAGHEETANGRTPEPW